MKLRTVQALRGMAAFAVLLCHLHAIEATKASGEPILGAFWITGAAGVDLFFVISGFIMVWVIGDAPAGRESALRFLFSRAARIYPLWWVFATLMALYFLMTYGQPWDPDRIGTSLDVGIPHLANSYLLLPQSEHPVLGVGWTLIHEMYFYVCFACLLLWVPERYRLVALSVWGCGIILGALVGLSGPFATNITALIFHTMSLEFLMGAFVAYAVRADKGRALAPYTALTGFASLVLVFTTFDFSTGGILLSGLSLDKPNTFTLSWGRTLCFGIPSALLLHGLASLETQRSFGRFVPDFAVRLGDWSYALYLSHVLVLSAMGRIFFGHIANAPDHHWDNGAFLILACTAAIMVSALTYYIIERPVIIWYTHWRKRLFRPVTHARKA